MKIGMYTVGTKKIWTKKCHCLLTKARHVSFVIVEEGVFEKDMRSFALVYLRIIFFEKDVISFPVYLLQLVLIFFHYMIWLWH